MKFSIGLFYDSEIGKNIFTNEITKANKLLNEIFGLDFNQGIPGTNDAVIDYDKKIYKIGFSFKNRYIRAQLVFMQVDVDVIQDALEIYEDARIIYSEYNLPGDFYDAVDKVINILEDLYDLNFTPLDPNDKDINIIDIIKKEPELFEVVFTHDDFEGNYKATMYEIEGHYELEVKQFIKNTIFLD